MSHAVTKQSGGRYISKRQAAGITAQRSAPASKYSRNERHTPYTRRGRTPPNTIINTASDSDDSVDLSTTRERDYEELFVEDRVTDADMQFIDDSTPVNEWGFHLRLDNSESQLEDELLMDASFDIDIEEQLQQQQVITGVPDRLREVAHETPPDDHVNVCQQVLHGFPCVSVYSGEGNNFLVQDTFINSDMHNVFIPRGTCRVITGPMGCGKTSLIKKYVEDTRSADPTRKFLYVTCNRTLCRASARSFGFQSYLDINIKDAIRNKELQSLVICINSLYKLNEQQCYTEFTDVILDEVVGIFDMLMGSLIYPEQRKNTIKMLSLLVDPQRNRKRTCIIADALVSDRELDFLKTSAHLGPHNVKIWRFFPPSLTQRLPEIVYCVSKNQWLAKLVTNMNVEGKRIVLPTSLKDHTYELLQLIQNADPDLIQDLQLDLNECLMSMGKTWFKVDGNTDPIQINRLLSNHAAILDANDRFLYTPVIQSGVDFNQNKPYHVGFGLAGTFFSANTFVQMLRRNRNFVSDVEGERAKIYVHVVGEESAWSEDCSVETLSTMIKEYAKMSSKKREQLAELVNISSERGRSRITDYFTTHLNEDVVRLMAYTLQASIKFKQDKLGYLKQVVKMNDPNWPFSVDHTESANKPVTAKHCRELLKNSASQWITQELHCKGDVLQCKDPEEVLALFRQFNCLGDKQVTDLEITKEAAMFPMRNTMELMVHRGRFCFGPFAVLIKSVFVGTSRETETYAVYKDNYNIGCMFREMFEAFREPWKDHICFLSDGSNGREFGIVAMNLEKLDTLVIDVEEILRYWKALARWNNRFATVLMGNDIDAIAQLDPNAQPTAKQVSLMKTIMAAVFGMLGIECRMSDKYKMQNGKRKRSVIRAVVDGIKRQHTLHGSPPEETFDDLVTVDTNKAVTVTLSEHVVNTEQFLRQYDLCLRRDIMELILVPPNRVERFLAFDSYMTGTTNSITDYNKKLLQKFIESLRVIDRQMTKQFMSTASYWILREPGYSVNLGILKTYTEEIQKSLKDLYKRMSLPYSHLEPTFLLSETPGSETSDEVMSDSQ